MGDGDFGSECVDMIEGEENEIIYEFYFYRFRNI